MATQSQLTPGTAGVQKNTVNSSSPVTRTGSRFSPRRAESKAKARRRQNNFLKQKLVTMERFLKDNGLSITMFSLFLTFLCGETIAGYFQHNHDLVSHGQPATSFWSFVSSSDLWEPVFENWESEFLEMSGYVFLTAYLIQKGSAESKNPEEPTVTKTHIPRWSKRHPILTWLYAHSLSMAFFFLFSASFAAHLVAGTSKYNSELVQHGQPRISPSQYLVSSQFWFESLQNWQSEFLGVFSIIVLSIWLREKGSPESKAMGSANSDTGK
jgi:hypothetical protein